MNNWKTSKLKDVCDRVTVGFVGSMAHEYQETGVPFFRSQNITSFRLNLDGLKYVSEQFHEKIRKSALHPGDVAVVRTGYPGTACVIPKELKVSNCSDLVIIRPGKQLNPYFLCAIFNSTFGRDFVGGNLVGAAQQHFNITVAKELKFLLPSRAVQDKIAAIVSTYNELIENNHRRIELLEKMAEEIYREWFVRMRFPSHEKAKIIKGVPEGWEVKKLGSVLELCYGKALKDDDRVPGEFHVYGSSGVVGTHNEALVKTPGLIVGRKGNVGSVYRSDRGFFPIDTVYYVKSELPNSFLYFLLRSMNFINNDAAVPGLNRNQAYSNLFFLPPAQLIKRYVEIADPLFKMKRVLTRKNEYLTSMRDKLLPRLISGKLSVEHLDIRFPPGMEESACV